MKIKKDKFIAFAIIILVWSFAIYMIHASKFVYKNIPNQKELIPYQGEITGFRCIEYPKSAENLIHFSIKNDISEIKRVHAITKYINCEWLEKNKNLVIASKVKIFLKEDMIWDMFLTSPTGFKYKNYKLIDYQKEKKDEYNKGRRIITTVIIISILITSFFAMIFVIRLRKDKSENDFVYRSSLFKHLKD